MVVRDDSPSAKSRRGKSFDVDKFVVLARKVRKIFEKEEKERREREFERFASGFQHPA